jgi:hypothetical protein
MGSQVDHLKAMAMSPDELYSIISVTLYRVVDSIGKILEDELVSVAPTLVPIVIKLFKLQVK